MIIVKIVKQPKYFAVVVAVTLCVIVFTAWLPNLHLVTKTLTSSTMSMWQRAYLLYSLLGSLQTNLTPFSRLVTFISAILAGVQVSLLIYYLKQAAKLQQSISLPESKAGMSVLGVITSMLGVGCASCGSVILTSFIGLGSTTTALTFLPFKGQEFGLLGIGILSFAIYLTVRKINNPLVCKIKA